MKSSIFAEIQNRHKNLPPVSTNAEILSFEKLAEFRILVDQYFWTEKLPICSPLECMALQLANKRSRKSYPKQEMFYFEDNIKKS